MPCACLHTLTRIYFYHTALFLIPLSPASCSLSASFPPFFFALNLSKYLCFFFFKLISWSFRLFRRTTFDVAAAAARLACFQFWGVKSRIAWISCRRKKSAVSILWVCVRACVYSQCFVTKQGQMATSSIVMHNVVNSLLNFWWFCHIFFSFILFFNLWIFEANKKKDRLICDNNQPPPPLLLLSKLMISNNKNGRQKKARG